MGKIKNEGRIKKTYNLQETKGIHEKTKGNTENKRKYNKIEEKYYQNKYNTKKTKKHK